MRAPFSQSSLITFQRPLISKYIHMGLMASMYDYGLGQIGHTTEPIKIAGYLWGPVLTSLSQEN